MPETARTWGSNTFKMAGRHHDEEQARLDKEDRRSAEMDELGSKVFNLKIALQEYEDRLAKLYQTEDRSKWKGPATLLVSFCSGVRFIRGKRGFGEVCAIG